jgi:hypothetical protein
MRSVRTGPGGQGRGERPSAAGKPLRLSALRGYEPQMSGTHCLRNGHVVVAHPKSIAKFFLAFELGFGVGDGERDALSVRAPSELRDPVLAMGQLQCVAAVHRHDEELSVLLGVRRDESDPIARGRPARRPGMVAVAGQRSNATGRDLDQHDLRTKFVAFQVRTSLHQRHSLTVRRQVRIGKTHLTCEVAHGSALRCRCIRSARCG